MGLQWDRLMMRKLYTHVAYNFEGMGGNGLDIEKNEWMKYNV